MCRKEGRKKEEEPTERRITSDCADCHSEGIKAGTEPTGATVATQPLSL